MCGQGETWRLRKRLGHQWERPSKSDEEAEQRRDLILGNEEARCPQPGGKKMVSNPNLTTLGVGVRCTDCQQR